MISDSSSSTSYDLVPYPSAPWPEAHPDRLAVLATLFGMKPTPIQNCRVLDIGCGDGANLLLIAYQLPGSECVGIDLSSRQIAMAQAQASALGLKNVTFQTRDILEIGAELGQFDYIISYGVYSWVPPQVQEKLLDLCRQCLTPHGVAYISYNVYPGWHMLQMLREMMLFHTRNESEPAQRAGQARTFLDFLTESTPMLIGRLRRHQAYSMILADEQEFLRQQSDSYILHDLLEEVNEPLYFYQFVERARHHALQYLGEADFSTMMGSHFMPGQVAEPLRGMAKTGMEMEQYMDFLRNRAFRHTLLCHEEVLLDRQVKPERLTGLYISSPSKPKSAEPDLHPTAKEQFQAPSGVSMAVDQPISKAALLYLAQIWPQAESFNDLLLAARTWLAPDTPPVYSAANLSREAEQLGVTLLTCYALNLVQLHTVTSPFVLEVSEYPTASAMARWQVEHRYNLVTNQRQELIPLDDELSLHLLPYLNGQHDRSALLNILLDLTAQGILVTPIADSGQLRELLADALEQTLSRLAQAALLVS